MDIDNDDQLSQAEVVNYFIIFDPIDFYHTAVNDGIIQTIFNYTYNNATTTPDLLYYEYLAAIWFNVLDPDNDTYISKGDYVYYIKTIEWINHNEDNNAYLSFGEFKEEFFVSTFYESFTQFFDKLFYSSSEAAFTAIDNIKKATSADITDTASQLTTFPHQFDQEIYGYTITVGDPSESILYHIPPIFISRLDLLVTYLLLPQGPSERRRLSVFNCSSFGEEDCKSKKECSWDNNGKR